MDRRLLSYYNRELAHLREMNHSPAFWDVVRSVVPDYERSRGSLRDGVVPILE